MPTKGSAPEKMTPLEISTSSTKELQITPQNKSETQVDPRGTYLRWVALIFASLLVPGNDYCYDIPQALQTQIQRIMGVGEIEYNLLYSLYSIPNLVLPFVGGFILDYWGIHIGVALYNSLILIGQGLFTIGGYTNTFSLLLVGRVIIGAGSESLNVAQSTILTMWFKGRQQTLALGVSLCVARLGSAANSAITPKIFNSTQSIGFCSLIGFFCVCFSAVCGAALIYMDKRYLAQVRFEEEKVSCKDIKKFNVSVWLLYFNAIICFQSFFSFFNIANKYYQTRFDFDKSRAGELLIIPYVVAGILTPFCSYAIDKIGRRGTLMIGATALLIITHLLFGFIPDCYRCIVSALPLVTMGLFFGLHVSLLIPSASVIVEERVMGSALGFITSGQNTGLAIGPLIVGGMLNGLKEDEGLGDGYFAVSMMLVGTATVAFIISIANYMWDRQNNNSRLERYKIGSSDTSQVQEYTEHNTTGSVCPQDSITSE